MDQMEIARTLLERREARNSFAAWCRLCGYEQAEHHALLSGRLEAIAAGEARRVAFFLPPGSAKSTYSSVLFPPWYLSRRKGRNASLIAASHTDTLAQTWGRRSRNLIAANSGTLGIMLSPDVQAMGQWETTDGGEYFAAGVGGSLPGRRADLAIIDDPVRNREDADSKGVRDKQWDWFLFDLIPRLKPDAAILLIQTRWHEDDLAGRILAAEGDRWEVIRIPMEAEDQDDPLGREPGQRLWPGWFTEAMVSEAKRDARVWSALYQQRPTPEGGNYFRREWLRPIVTMPPKRDLAIYGASDYAVTSDGGDYTVHVIVGIDSNEDLYLLDLYRAQAASDDWVEQWCDLVRLWRPIRWAEEGGQINASVGPFLKKRARQRKAYTYRQQFPPRKDKAVRAQSIRGRMSMNGLFYHAGAPWREAFESELLRFPAGKHDDMVDALGLIGQLLDVARAGEETPAPTDMRSETGYSPWREEREDRPFSAADI